MGTRRDDSPLGKPKGYSYIHRERTKHTTKLPGHGLLNRDFTGTDHAECKCGRRSLEPMSNLHRRMWQTSHLKNVRFRAANPGDLTTVILHHTGITYRQLDHWVRRGYLPAKQAGTGKPRVWHEDALFIAMEMSRLVKVGFTAEAAADLAHTIVLRPTANDTYRLPNGMAIQITSREENAA